MANAARLEIDFTFDGKDYSVRPTFEIVTAIESVTGQGCTALAEKFWATEPKDYASLTLTSQVVFAILRSTDPKITPKIVAAVLMDDGCGPLYQPLGEFCSRALRGHKEHVRLVEEQNRERERAEEAARAGAPNPPEQPPTTAEVESAT